MSIHLSPERIVKRAVQLACLGNPHGALQLLQPLELNPTQREMMRGIFEAAINSTDAPSLQKHVLSLLSVDAERQVASKGSPLLDLPAEDVFPILSALDLRSILRCSQVCQFLYDTTRNEFFYQKIYDRTFASCYPANDLSLDFYQACKKGYTSQLNFLNGVYAKKIMRPTINIASLVFSQGLICRGLFNGMIEVWDMKTLKSVITFQGHDEQVHLLSILDDKLCSASDDNTIKIWKPKTGECLLALDCPESPSSFCQLNEKLYVGFYDGRIKVWDLKTGEVLEPFVGHQAEVKSLALFDGMLFSCSFDGTIKKWDPETRECLKTFCVPRSLGVYSFTIFDGNLYGGCWKSPIRVWDLKSGELVDTLLSHEHEVFSLVIVDGKLCSFDGTICILDLKTEDVLKIPSGRFQDPASLTFFAGKFWSGSPDEGITTFDFSAEHRAIFIEIATLFKSGNLDRILEALARFDRMPTIAKNRIYGELNLLLASPIEDDNERTWLKAPPDQKAQAIENYLASQ